MGKSIKQIIDEFFSKECKVRNTTLDELLEKHNITSYIFWSVIHSECIRVKSKENSIATSVDKNLLIEKLKKEDKIRFQKQESLDIYRTLKKDKTKTFGDIARERNCPVNVIYERLQSPYLKKIENYSYETILKNNMKLLQQRKEFEMYFYFLKYKVVTFQQLAEHFQVEEADVIIYFDSTVATELSSKEIQKIFTLNKERMKNATSKIYQYYESHFILFRDLSSIFQIETNELVQYYVKNHEKQSEWEKIQEMEQERQILITKNIDKLNAFAKLVQLWKSDMKSQKIENELINLIQGKFLMCELERQNSFLESLITSIQFTIAYLKQGNYDVINLKQEFGIKSKNTVHKYLHNSLIVQLLDADIVAYISNKRSICEQLQRVKNSEAHKRDEKGQFVKKYQPLPNEE